MMSWMSWSNKLPTHKHTQEEYSTENDMEREAFSVNFLFGESSSANLGNKYLWKAEDGFQSCYRVFCSCQYDNDMYLMLPQYPRLTG